MPCEAPLALDEGHEKAADQVAQLRDALQHALAGALLPALDHDLAVAGVERGDHALRAAARCSTSGLRGGAEHHLLRAAIEPGDLRSPRRGCRRPRRHGARSTSSSIDRGVRALPERGIEIDHRDLADQAEAPRERARIAGIQRLGLAADQLDRLAVLQVDRGDDHGRSITLSSRQSFHSSIVGRLP